MRTNGMLIAIVMGLMIAGLLLIPGQTSAVGGQDVDHSMIKTESGADTYFIDSSEGSLFLLDILTGKDKVTKIGFIVMNPDTDIDHSITVTLNVPEGNDWKVNIAGRHFSTLVTGI